MDEQTIRVSKPSVLEEIPTDQSCVVEASAGTGKTYALEHLIIELIVENELAISNILVVTFTERATAELVERVRGILQRLVDMREGDAGPEEPHWELDASARERVREALFSFDRAPIYTIHGFCRRVLVEHAFANRRPFEQELVEFDELFEEAVSRALREDLTTDPARSLVLETYLGDNSVERLRSRLASAVSTTDRVAPVGDFEGFADSIEEFEEALRAFRKTLDEMRDVFEEVDADDAMHGTMRSNAWENLRAIEKAYRAYDERGLAGFVGTLNAEADEPFEYLQQRKLFNKSHRERYRDAWGAELQRLADFHLEPLPLIFDEFVPVVERHLEELKAENGVFTYDDMLELVRRAVCGADGEELVETLRDEYEFALVDEFQDTDPIQWAIFRRLFVESGGSNPCVLIGDPKQAIYGFRGADVRTYFDARDEVVARSRREEPVDLKDNYRSSESLIDAYNKILEHGADGAFFRPPNNYEEDVDCGDEEIALVDASGEEVDPVVVTQVRSPGDDGFSAAGYRGALARSWAAEIRDVLGVAEGSSPLRMWDTDEEQFRPLVANDVYVLTRTRSAGDKFAEFLRAVGVPYAFYKREGLFETPEARDWYRVLRAVDQPGDRSRRLKAWTTPFFGLELSEAADADEVVDEHHELVGRLNEWNDLARAGRVAQLVHRILDRTGILRRQVFERHGERELTNYDHLAETFVDWAQSDDLAVDGIVARLWRYLEGEAEPEGREGDMQRLETEQEAVQIMTMHKAKGLSAPVVFVFGGYEYADRRPYRFYQDDERVLYFGPKGAGGDIDAYRQEESERLLYVSMTRPEGRLYLPHADASDHEGSLSRGRSPMGPLTERLDALLEGEPPSEFRIEQRRANPSPPDAGVDRTADAPATDVDLREVAERVDRSDENPADGVDFGGYRARRRLFVESYSSVDRWRRAGEEGPESDEALELEEREEAAEEDTLGTSEPDGPPAGRRTGLAVHALLEDLDYAKVGEAGDVDEWRGTRSVREVFDSVLAHYGLEEHRDGLEGLVWRALTSSVSASGVELESLASVDRRTAELEFWYPIPGETGPSIDSLLDSDGRVARSTDRGYLRGFIDLIFEAGGRVYAADWKTNWLTGDDPYAPEAIEEIVEQRYEVQALFYTTAAARLLARVVDDIDEFEERFGGLMYLFVRGMAAGNGESARGVYFERPGFEELCSWEQRAGEMVAEKLDARRHQIARGGYDRWRTL